MNCLHNCNHYMSDIVRCLRSLHTSAAHHLGRPTLRLTCFVECLRQNRQAPTRHLYCLHICNHRILECAQRLKDQDTSATRHLNCLHVYNQCLVEFVQCLKDLDTSAAHHLGRPTLRLTCLSNVLGKFARRQLGTCTVRTNRISNLNQSF